MKEYIKKRIVLNILTWSSLLSFVIVYFGENTNNIIYNAVVFLMFFITMVENDILEEIKKSSKELTREDIERIMKVRK